MTKLEELKTVLDAAEIAWDAADAANAPLIDKAYAVVDAAEADYHAAWKDHQAELNKQRESSND